MVMRRPAQGARSCHHRADDHPVLSPATPVIVISALKSSPILTHCHFVGQLSFQHLPDNNMSGKPQTEKLTCRRATFENRHQNEMRITLENRIVARLASGG